YSSRTAERGRSPRRTPCPRPTWATAQCLDVGTTKDASRLRLLLPEWARPQYGAPTQLRPREPDGPTPEPAQLNRCTAKLPSGTDRLVDDPPDRLVRMAFGRSITPALRRL